MKGALSLQVVFYRAKKSKDVRSQLNKVLPLLREAFGDMIPEAKEEKGRKHRKIEHRCPSHVQLRIKFKMRDFSEKILMVRNK